MKQFMVNPGAKVDLSKVDPADTSAWPGVTKENHQAMLDHVRARLRQQHAMLIAQRKHRVLVVLQAMDAGGKDGTVRNAFFGLDPLGLAVTAFKAPTATELDHDFLWRVHQRVPGRGQIGVFNRSHYEDIVAVSVKNLAPKEVWERRYEHVNAFEKMLADEGTTILKFFLHIDQKEQRERLQSRLEDPTKRWKIDPADLADRARWDDFQRAYEAVLSRTSTPHAPWFIIPANRKWFRNLAVAALLRDALQELKLEYPAVNPALADVTAL